LNANFLARIASLTIKLNVLVATMTQSFRFFKLNLVKRNVVSDSLLMEIQIRSAKPVMRVVMAAGTLNWLMINSDAINALLGSI
jgi:hypothetical protein